MEVIMKAEGRVVYPGSPGSVISAITQYQMCYIKNDAESSSRYAHKKVNMFSSSSFAISDKNFCVCFVISNVIGQL